MNNRRKLLVALGASVIAAPLGSVAQQQTKVWRVGFLTLRHVDFVDSDVYYGPFRQGMRELGYVEGKNLVIEWRSAGGKYDRLPGLATELVNLKVDVIVTASTAATSAAQEATTTIPIVMGNAGDPVGSGFVISLARPAGNITGLTGMQGDVLLKRLELLHGMVPKLSSLAVLVNPYNTENMRSLKLVQSAGQKFGIKILRADATSAQEIDNAFSWMHQQNATALFMFGDGLFQQQKSQIAELTAKHRLPAITSFQEHTEAGVLMSYAPNRADNFRRAATYADKIFKGANPGDLPVEQPTIFELFINGKTAKALGLTIPQSLLISPTR